MHKKTLVLLVLAALLGAFLSAPTGVTAEPEAPKNSRVACYHQYCLRVFEIVMRWRPGVDPYPVAGLGAVAEKNDSVYHDIRLENVSDPMLAFRGTVSFTVSSNKLRIENFSYWWPDPIRQHESWYALPNYAGVIAVPAGWSIKILGDGPGVVDYDYDVYVDLPDGTRGLITHWAFQTHIFGKSFFPVIVR